jgi:hypothetical protein
MNDVRLGRSGLEVSRVVLGCMSFGDPARGTHEWALGPDEARPIIRQALEAGITTFDTANTYSLGVSEEIVGTLLGELARRDEVVIATKVFGRMRPGPKGWRALPRRHPRPGRREPPTAPHRLHRPLPDPPLRPDRADRGDDGGAPRPRPRRQGALPRSVVDGDLAVRPGPIRRRPPRLDPVRLHAGPVQPAHARAGCSTNRRSPHRSSGSPDSAT